MLTPSGLARAAASLFVLTIAVGPAGAQERTRPPRSRDAARGRAATPGEEAIEAARTGDAAKLKELLDQNPALISAKDSLEQTSLHHAKTKEVAEMLLAASAPVDAKGYYEVTPLAAAASEGRTEVIEVLLAHHADVNAKDQGGRTPLDRAVASGQEATAAFLRTHGGVANVQPTSDAHANDLAREAIQAGLEVAVMKGLPDKVHELIKMGGNPNGAVGGRSLLCTAIEFDKPEVVEALLKEGANPNLPDADGTTPLRRAMGNEQITAMLKTAGAK